MAFEVALGLNISEPEARSYPASKMVGRFDWIAQRQWEDTVRLISATQVGVTRALAVGFGKKGANLPDLPTYEQMLRRQRKEKPPLPDWMVEFETVNKDRAIQMATQQRVRRDD